MNCFNFTFINEKQISQIINKILFIINSLILIYIIKYIYYNKINNKPYLNENNNYEKQIKLNYSTNKFAIISVKCKACGLFAIYKHSLACLINFIFKGYIPLIDLLSLPNIFNSFNNNNTKLKINPWEFYFNQPYGYKLKSVEEKAKNKKYFKCNTILNLPNYFIYLNKGLSDFWHNIALKYIPIKVEIVNEANIIIKKLFKGSKNVLGVLARGTDYISLKPSHHPKPPKINIMIKDIKEMNLKYKYDWIFLTTEDYSIKSIFIQTFKNKLKYLKKNDNINYNYKEKKNLGYNEKIKGNLQYQKNYLINIIILSKCIDIISALTSGTIGTFILSEGFRNSKIYFSGFY